MVFSQEKEGILPFVTMWMDLEGTVISERNQRKTNTVYHIYMESKKVELIETVEWWLPAATG